MQADPLDRCPDDGQATHLRGEHIDLVGSLPNIAEETLDGIGGPNIAVHRRRKLVKGEGVPLFLGQAPHRLGIELAIFSW
jgi:hypothetical protein